jgi:Fic family protein
MALIAVPVLDEADHAVLDGLAGMRTELRYQVAEPRRWIGQLRRSLTAGAIRGSNSIEGYTISESDAEALVAGEELSAAPDPETEAAVEGYRDALTYVQQAADFEVFHYDDMLLSVLHFVMTRYRLDKWPGRYRRTAVWVSGGPGNPPVYTAPDADLVPGLMTELIDWLNGGDLDAPLYVRAAMAHLNLVSIHPWRDGNGRMSRCLHTLLLAQDQILAPEFSSIEEWIGTSTANTGRYYAALQATRPAWDPAADAHDWVRFCLRAHHLQAQRVRQRFASGARLWEDLTALAGESRLDERMISALFAAAGGHLRRATYQRDEGLSRDQAIRDLQLLGKLGLIEPAGSGRARHYAAGSRIAGIVRAAGELISDRTLTEPYPASGIKATPAD